MGHTVSFDSQKNVVNFTTGFGTVISSVLGPFIQLKVNRLYYLKAAHAGYCLNEMTCIALTHVAPLILHIIVR